MLDIHSHVLPGVDDGALDYKAAIKTLRAARQAGISKLVSTPHVKREWDVERCRAAYISLHSQSEDIWIELVQGCELSVRALVDYLDFPERLAKYTVGNTNFIMLEFQNNAPPMDWEYLICDVIRLGYQVIIAHPERYQYIAKDIGIAQKFINYGCELQADTQSLLGSKFSTDHRTAVSLLDRGLLSYIASDAHRPIDFNSFAKAYHVFGRSWPVGLLSHFI